MSAVSARTLSHSLHNLQFSLFQVHLSIYTRRKLGFKWWFSIQARSIYKPRHTLGMGRTCAWATRCLAEMNKERPRQALLRNLGRLHIRTHIHMKVYVRLQGIHRASHNVLSNPNEEMTKKIIKLPNVGYKFYMQKKPVRFYRNQLSLNIRSKHFGSTYWAPLV